jgi:hypothetical protein
VIDLARARELGSHESGLAVVIARRADGSPYASVVNAGIVTHPLDGQDRVGFVARGGTRKLPNLRRDPRVTVVFRCGWNWLAVEGIAELIGPDDSYPGLDGEDHAGLLRSINAAAVGGEPDDWRELDAEMAGERHTAVLVRPTRCYSGTP